LEGRVIWQTCQKLLLQVDLHVNFGRCFDRCEAELMAGEGIFAIALAPSGFKEVVVLDAGTQVP
jgi:hypothetical protein